MMSLHSFNAHEGLSNTAPDGRRRELIKAALATGGMTFLPFTKAFAADEMDRLYEEAKREGVLNYYGGGPIATHQGALAEFSKTFPGIRVKLETGFSNQLTPRIDEQIARNAVDADVAVLQTIQDFERWKRAGALMSNRGPNFNNVIDTFKDAEGTSVGVRVYALAYAYNPDLVSSQDVPKSALDFLHPRFSGKIISTYPQDDDITLYLYHGIVKKHGWDYMPRLMANKPRFIRGHVGVTEEIAAGRSALSFDASAANAAGSAASGGRIQVVFPAEETVPIWETRCGIFKGAPHPNAARLFQAWILSKDYQARQGAWSTRSDVAPANTFKPITAYNTASRFREFMLDESLVADLRKRFESYIGPVSGDPVLGGAPAKG